VKPSEPRQPWAQRTRGREQLERALADAREQQTATSEILRLISRSTFDLQPVLEMVIDRATRLCSATRGHIFKFDGEFLRFAAAYGATSEFTDWLRRSPIAPGPGTVAGRAAAERRTVHVHDVLAQIDYQGLALQMLQDYRTVLAVPMLRDEALLGVITILKSEVEPFTDEQIALVTTFADQAVIAIENIRLVQELQARTQALARSVSELTALAEIGRAVSSTLNLKTVLHTILARAVQLSGTIGGVIYEYDEIKQEFHVRGAYHADDEIIDVLRAAPVRLGEGAIGIAAMRRAPVQVTDVLDAREYAVIRIRAVFARLGHRFMIAVPFLRGSRDRRSRDLAPRARPPCP
jgi:two-component system, NtrC family, sensor kinase